MKIRVFLPKESIFAVKSPSLLLVNDVYFSKANQVRFFDRPLSGYWKQTGNTLEFAVLPEHVEQPECE